MSVTVATRAAATAALGSIVTVGAPTGATINQRLRGGLFGFVDQTVHVGPTVAAAAAAHAGTAVSVRRIDGALNYTPIKAGGVDGTHPTLGQSGDYSYDFTILDAYIASHPPEGADELYISLDYCPQILGGNLPPSPSSSVPFALGGLYYRGPGPQVPNDLPAFGTICADIVDRAVTRCAFHGLDFNYVGLWNEPDLPFAYFNGDVTDWIAMYAAAAPAIKAIHPSIKVGGPELATVNETTAVEWIEAWLTYCKANAIPADCVTWHSYSATGWNLRQDVRFVDTAVANAEWEGPLDYIVGEMAGATIANWPGFAPPFGTNTTEKLTLNDHSAVVLALQMIEAQELGIDRIMYFASQSMNVTAFEGLFNANGPTAAGNVYRLWQMMGDADALEVTLAADPGVHALAAERDGTIYVLFVSDHYRRGQTYPVTIEVPGANGRETTLTVIDRAHSNQWDAGIENAELQTVPVTDVANEQVRLTMQARSVCLLEIAP